MSDSTATSPDLWQSKPWWCQPWTIILTGVILIASSWLLFHQWWITLPWTLIIGVWWLYFLVLVPQMLRKMALATNDQQKS